MRRGAGQDLPGFLSPEQKEIRDAAAAFYDAKQAQKASAKAQREKVDLAAEELAEVLERNRLTVADCAGYQILAEKITKLKVSRRKGVKAAAPGGQEPAA